MKIVVSSRGLAPESEVDPRFGRAFCFLVFDSGTTHWQSIENKQSLSAAHGAGIQSAEMVCRLGANVVISGDVGPKAFDVLKAAGVKVYSSGAATAREAVGAFERGVLHELSASNA